MKLFFRVSVFIFFSLVLATGASYADKKDYRSPEQVDGALTTSLQQAKKLFDSGTVFIDVRNPRFYARGHIPGAHHLDFRDNFDESKLDGIAKKDQPIVIYCSGVKCSRSYRASAKAISWGFSRVHYFRVGFSDWKKAGYEIEISKISKNSITNDDRAEK